MKTIKANELDEFYEKVYRLIDFELDELKLMREQWKKEGNDRAACYVSGKMFTLVDLREDITKIYNKMKGK